MTEAQKIYAELSSEFSGYPAPTSNTTYTPNQFFDVVLPYSSRGCVRLVSYMVRKMIGWCDADGRPIKKVVAVSHRELAFQANVSRGALCKAIREAIEKRYIRRIIEAKPATKGNSHTTGAYELRWNKSGRYTTNPESFDGFFAGEGNRTYVPNVFFDQTIRTESLALIKTVGTIIRHTIGFQDEYGFRRKHVRMSYKELERRTGLSPKHLNLALNEALRKNHISVVEKGSFDPDAGRQSRPAIYGIRWEDDECEATSGSKKIVEITTATSHGRIKKDSGLKLGGSKRIVDKRTKKVNGSGSKTIAARRIKKDSDIEIKQKNKTPKQQQHRQGAEATVPETPRQPTHSAAVAFSRLIKEGFDKKSAKLMLEQHPPEQILRQCELMPKRTVTKNRLGMLRRAIEQNWPEPSGRANFSPSSSSRENSPLLICNSANSGARVSRASNLDQIRPVRKAREAQNVRKTAEELERLRKKEKELKENAPALYQQFLDEEARQRREIEQMPMVGKQLIQKVLESFDSEKRRLERMICSERNCL